MKKQNYVITLIALCITATLLYSYRLTFQNRWPGKQMVDVHALWGTSVLGKTGNFNDKAILELAHPIDRLRVYHENGYQLKVYEPNYIIHGQKRLINEDMDFEIQTDGTLTPIK